jgi:hypothetical protein
VRITIKEFLGNVGATLISAIPLMVADGAQLSRLSGTRFTSAGLKKEVLDGLVRIAGTDGMAHAVHDMIDSAADQIADAIVGLIAK